MAIFNIAPKGSNLDDYLPLSGGTVTGPTAFENTVSMNNATIGDLIVTGNATVTNNLQVNTINGNTTYADYIASGNIKNMQKTEIYANEFNGDVLLRNMDFPQVSIIGTSGVANCTNLKTFVAGSAINNLTIKSYAFQNCTSLTTVDLSKTTSIESYAFQSCTALTAVSFPNITTLNANYCFASCTALTTLSFPNLTTISNSPFTGVGSSTKLATLSFPKVTTVSGAGMNIDYVKSIYFNVLTHLSFMLYGTYTTTVSLPMLQTITTPGQIGAGQATNLSLPKLTTFSKPDNYFYYSGFNNMSRLQTLTLNVATAIPSSSIFNGNFAALQTFNAPCLTQIISSLFSSENRFSALKTLNCSRVTTIGEHAFEYCSALTTYSFPLVTSIGNYAFYKCSALTTANFPALISAYDYAFGHCYSLTTVSMPNVTTIGCNIFVYCSALTTISLPKATSIVTLTGCTNIVNVYVGSATGTYTDTPPTTLQSIHYPLITSIAANTFSSRTSCSNITYFSFPKVTSIGTSGVWGLYSTNLVNLAAYSSTVLPFNYTSFTSTYSTNFGTLVYGIVSLTSSLFYSASTNYGCNMTNLILPNCTSVNTYAFASAWSKRWNLTTVSLPKVSYIGSYAFYYCSKLTTVYLNGISSIPTLSRSVAFPSTIVSIYVPNSLLASFKTATYWSYFSNQMIGV